MLALKGGLGRRTTYEDLRRNALKMTPPEEVFNAEGMRIVKTYNSAFWFILIRVSVQLLEPEQGTDSPVYYLADSEPEDGPVESSR